VSTLSLATIRGEFVGAFLAEANRQIDLLDECLLSSRGGPASASAMAEAFRVAHGLKGSAATMGYQVIADLAHAVEDLLSAMRAGRYPSHDQWRDVLRNALGVLRSLCLTIEAEGDEGLAWQVADADAALRELVATCADAVTHPLATTPLGAIPDGALAMLVSIDDGTPQPATVAAAVLDALNKAGTLVRCIPSRDEIAASLVGRRLLLVLQTSRPNADMYNIVNAVPDVAWARIARGADAHGMYLQMPSRELLEAQLREARHSGPAPRMLQVNVDVLDRLQTQVEGFAATCDRLAIESAMLATRYPGDGDVTALTDSLRAVRTVVEALGRDASFMRHVPAGVLFCRLPRLLSDVAHQQGKKAGLVLEGQETLVDRTVGERLLAVLSHLLNNAACHGIEHPEERAQRGKCPSGMVSLALAQHGAELVMRVEDDGAGIDAERLRRAAVSAGRLSAADAAALAPEAAYRLVFIPGISTADQVSRAAGRGVGMDIVLREVSGLGGRIDIDSTPGVSTRFTVRVPHTPAAARNVE
jgi:two-component system chemotaxis sensor kinase CheA